MDADKRIYTAIHCGMEGEFTVLEAADEETAAFLNSLKTLRKKNDTQWLLSSDDDDFFEVFDKCNIRPKREASDDDDDGIIGQLQSQFGCGCGGNCDCDDCDCDEDEDADDDDIPQSDITMADINMAEKNAADIMEDDL